VGGNIGTPAISLAEQAKPETVIVLEISSFQLETIQTFRPKVAVILNITPDHLDRHRSFEAYTDVKARIFENQKAGDFAVLNADDPTCVAMAARTRAQVFWFSRQKEVTQGASVQDGAIVFRGARVARKEVNPAPSFAPDSVFIGPNERQTIMLVSEIPLKGGHNLENVLAAVSAGVLMGCAHEKIRQAVREFKAVEHRLEFVATICGVDYYNDSKATNVDATIKALESFPTNIHLILGGKDKGSDYTVLNDLLLQRVKRVYTIGAAAAKIESQLKGVDVVHAETLENALRKAHAVAQSGDVVLLAPACASFDQFKNYEHRGQVFKDIVRALVAADNGSSPGSSP